MFAIWLGGTHGLQAAIIGDFRNNVASLNPISLFWHIALDSVWHLYIWGGLLGDGNWANLIAPSLVDVRCLFGVNLGVMDTTAVRHLLTSAPCLYLLQIMLGLRHAPVNKT